ncbi:unnamed protein product [Cylicocyclus nassatus]|uniref:NADP-dependent oxidoreductase domain-containing protein n=1 Tax=Cylicocyclus nassatus TaxID=53992 RepID=A0AA36DLA9_CYLNA|nr:unnamed protein product [Cylicocyclus nassatus]
MDGTIKLSSGGSMPILGLGTWLSENEEELTTALKAALDGGYRLIDTAFIYHNEAVIGKVLQEYFKNGKLKRSDIFITTKLPFTAHAPEDVARCFQMQLDALQLDYVDLYLIHCPVPVERKKDSFEIAFVDDMQVYSTVDHLDTWRAMEKLYDAGKAKALGLSNFNAKQIQRIYDNVRIKPANLQVECHLYWPQNELYEFCKAHNISFTAYAPLGSRAHKNWNPNLKWGECDPLTDPTVKELAEKHHKTPAQILLRFLIERGMAVIPKSVKPKRVKENSDVFDFSLSEEEMQKLTSIKIRTRIFVWDLAIGHPFYPFDDVDQSQYKKVSLKENNH